MQNIPVSNLTFGLSHDSLNSVNFAKAIQGKLNCRITTDKTQKGSAGDYCEAPNTDCTKCECPNLPDCPKASK